MAHLVQNPLFRYTLHQRRTIYLGWVHRSRFKKLSQRQKDKIRTHISYVDNKEKSRLFFKTFVCHEHLTAQCPVSRIICTSCKMFSVNLFINCQPKMCATAKQNVL